MQDDLADTTASTDEQQQHFSLVDNDNNNTNRRIIARNSLVAEAEARLSVFEKYLFLVDDETATSSNYIMNHDDNDYNKVVSNTDLDDSTTTRTNNNNDNDSVSNRISDIMNSGYPGNEIERQEINKSLSVFDDFLCLIAHNVDK